MGLIGTSVVGVSVSLLGTRALYTLHLRQLVQSACAADGSSVAEFATVLRYVDQDFAALPWARRALRPAPGDDRHCRFPSELRRA